MPVTHSPVYFDESFDVVTGYDMLKDVPTHLQNYPLGNKYKIFVSEDIAGLYGEPLFEGMKELRLNVTLEPIKDGEEVKRDTVAAKLRRLLHREEFDRRSCLIIVGGGTLSDLVGYVAGTYKRGIPYINIPTTFIGQTDAGIGGKTGVDDEFGKNMIGVFYNPRRIYLDPKLLVSLPNQEVVNGMGEVIKYGVGFRPDIFEFLEQSHEKVFARNPETYEFIVHESAKTKVSVVKEDPRETRDIRTSLNLGHTTGHGIEKATNYGLQHGLAVGLGLVVATELSAMRGIMSRDNASRIVALLKLYGLPTKISQIGYVVTKSDIMGPMVHDKKTVGGVVNYVLPNGIGSLQKNGMGGYSNPVGWHEIEKALDVIF
ncbi:MAG: 3-dehydroquinate synthase [Candidatus Aenigmarchaeota archaeon]|nr:3-dehydroquinate synthase [Candidatus Aenigmarchaeota archaeon]